MGWRKLAITDGDLARCSDLSATEQGRRTPTFGTINCGSISERLLSDRRRLRLPVVGPVDAQ